MNDEPIKEMMMEEAIAKEIVADEWHPSDQNDKIKVIEHKEHIQSVIDRHGLENVLKALINEYIRANNRNDIAQRTCERVVVENELYKSLVLQVMRSNGCC